MTESERGRGMTTARDYPGAVWRKSMRSNGTGSNCVEVADLGTAVAVRDSKDPNGPALVFTSEARAPARPVRRGLTRWAARR